MKLLNTIIWGIIKITLLIGATFTLVIVINSVIRGDKIEPGKTYGPTHNFQYPKSDEVMNEVDMDCGDSDEYKMWIGGDGDTIWE